MKKRGNGLVTAVSLMLIGILFIIFKSDVISIAMSLIAAVLIIMGIFSLDLAKAIKVEAHVDGAKADEFKAEMAKFIAE